MGKRLYGNLGVVVVEPFFILISCYEVAVEVFQNFYPIRYADIIVVSGCFAAVADVIKEVNVFAFPLVVQVIIQFKSCKSRNKLLH